MWICGINTTKLFCHQLICRKLFPSNKFISILSPVPLSIMFNMSEMFKMSFLLKTRIRTVWEFSSSKSCVFLSSRISLWSSRQFGIHSPRMNVHRGTESDRLLRQEASCLMDEASAAAQEKEGNSPASSGLQNLTYPLGPRNDGMMISFWFRLEGFLTPEHLFSQKA